MDIKTAEAAGLVYSGKNAEGENEFVGTKEQWQRAENFEQGDNMTLEEVADKEAVKIKVEDEEVLCEKCGEPTTHKLVGDEWYDYCKNCNWTTNN